MKRLRETASTFSLWRRLLITFGSGRRAAPGESPPSATKRHLGHKIAQTKRLTDEGTAPY